MASGEQLTQDVGKLHTRILSMTSEGFSAASSDSTNELALRYIVVIRSAIKLLAQIGLYIIKLEICFIKPL